MDSCFTYNYNPNFKAPTKDKLIWGESPDFQRNLPTTLCYTIPVQLTLMDPYINHCLYKLIL